VFLGFRGRPGSHDATANALKSFSKKEKMSDKKLFILAGAITIVVLAVVVILNIISQPGYSPDFVKYLPLLNACLNGTCTVLLLFSLYCIKQKQILWHKRINIITFSLSSVFLISYILFHYFVEETKYGDANHDGIVDAVELAAAGGMRIFYFAVLISHIALAAIVLPLVLISFYWGLKMEVKKHKRIVHLSYPIWLYVTITGVLVYLMISPYYNFDYTDSHLAYRRELIHWRERTDEDSHR
jgi:putative membrane protein